MISYLYKARDRLIAHIYKKNRKNFLALNSSARYSRDNRKRRSAAELREKKTKSIG